MRIISSRQTGCDVVVGSGLDAGKIIASRSDIKRAAVITDKTVGALYAKQLCISLLDCGIACQVFTVPGGEGSKSLATYCDIIAFLAKNGITKADAIVSLGGGVAGDIAGFCAATYMRGVELFHVPTSLLAMVDSSVGGKNALNLPEGKNLVGTVYRPRAVVCDTDYLKTLPAEFRTDALAEIIKYGVIADENLFESFDKADEADVVARCVEIKLEYVDADEFDMGVRHCLNLGHTVGHAVEMCSGCRISHGRAVAIGMAVTADACAQNGVCSRECAERIKNRIESVGLPAQSPFAAQALMQYIACDKKAESGGIRLALPESVGKCTLKLIKADDVRAFLFGGCDESNY